MIPSLSNFFVLPLFETLPRAPLGQKTFYYLFSVSLKNHGFVTLHLTSNFVDKRRFHQLFW